LIPWKDAADDHQSANVRYLSDVGAAILVNEENVASTLVKIIVNLRAHPEELGKISHQAYEMGAVNRQGKIAEVIKDVANRHVA
jgi:UDP-N-acetylglucosamine:LPS N-acetylglucosamine transferase